MRFLNRLFLHCADWLAQRQRSKDAEHTGKPSSVDSFELAANELVTRFIYHHSQINKPQTRLLRGAFDPGRYDELSVVHSTGLPDTDVWEIGKLTLGTQIGRDKIRGRADVPVKALIRNKLRAIRDDKPFKRHTSVVGWPNPDDPDQKKQQRIDICLKLSQDPDVKLFIPESPITRSV